MKKISVSRIKDLFTLDKDDWVLKWRNSKGPAAPAGATAGYINPKDGHRYITIDHYPHKADKLVWAHFHGELPPNELLHLNNDRSNNRIGNLQLATRSRIMQHKRTYRNNTSGTPGVFWYKARQRWCANIRVKGKTKHLGYYKDKAAAIFARERAEELYLHRTGI